MYFGGEICFSHYDDVKMKLREQYFNVLLQFVYINDDSSVSGDKKLNLDIKTHVLHGFSFWEFTRFKF